MRSSVKLAAIALTLVVALACWAQYGSPSEPQEQPGTTQQPMTGHQQMRAEGAQNRLNWLSQQLDLTASQQAKLRPILQNEEQQMRSIHQNTSLTMDQKRSQMRQVYQSTEPQIESVLTPEQQQKFAQIKQQRREQRQGNMGTSGGNQSNY